MTEELEQKIISYLSDKISPFLIILFGSSVNGATHPESDIDIAFLSDNKKLDKYLLFMTAQELAAQIGQDVDLIDLSSASTVFQAQIVHTGKIIYCTNERKKAEFQIKALKMFTKLNEERHEILKKINESGSIYEK